MNKSVNSSLSRVMNTYGRLPVSLVRGKGAWLFDEAGKAYLDTVTGIGVCSLGHCHPDITAAIVDQANTLVHAANVAGAPLQEELAARLAEISGLDNAFFCNSGAESLECAFKLARLHGQQRGIAEPQIVVVTKSFHGRTLACLSATDSKKVQGGFEPLVPGFIRVTHGDVEAVRHELESRRDIAAVLVEPILGEGGVVLPPDGYFRALRAMCDSHDALMMLDEVQTGIGKTGKWFAHHHEGVKPDVMALAKALGNGVPIGACLAGPRAANLFSPGRHGSTYGGNPLACRVALTVLDVIERDGLLQQTIDRGQQILKQLRDELAGHSSVADIRGRGLMIGVELIGDCNDLKLAALDEGLILNITRDRVIRLLPPMTTTPSEAEQMAVAVIKLVKSWSS